MLVPSINAGTMVMRAASRVASRENLKSSSIAWERSRKKPWHACRRRVNEACSLVETSRRRERRR
jgi:hypothetical protein